MSTANDGGGGAALYSLRLFVAGTTVRSQRAIGNLHSICQKYLTGPLDLAVIDLYQQPELAERYQVVAAPTLVRLLPLPVRRIVGDLSETNRVLRGLEISPQPRGDTRDA